VGNFHPALTGPTSVRFVKRELLDSGSVVWAFHKRSFDA
jgi:hypothetical protein